MLTILFDGVAYGMVLFVIAVGGLGVAIAVGPERGHYQRRATVGTHTELAHHLAILLATQNDLLIRFANGLAIRTHLRMHGSWHRYRPGERWRRPASRAPASPPRGSPG